MEKTCIVKARAIVRCAAEGPAAGLRDGDLPGGMRKSKSVLSVSPNHMATPKGYRPKDCAGKPLHPTTSI
ncbi:unnamed protein product [Boreogadus saida]